MRKIAVLAAALVLSQAGEAAAQLKLSWDVEGYYRTRGVLLSNLAAEPRVVINTPMGDELVLPEIRRTSYITQRLRLNPTLTLYYPDEKGGISRTAPPIAKLYMEINAFDDVLFGDNNAISSAPLFAVNGSNQYYLGGNTEVPTAQFSRAWVEFQVPVGLMRVGRMPSHWGLGILANGGGSGNEDPLAPAEESSRKVQDYYFDEEFGDNHFGSTNDRILFATRPLTIAKTIMKKADTSSNLVLAYAFDKLSEAPFLFSEEDRRFRPFGVQGFISRGEDDDVDEHVFVLAYANADWDKVRYTDELKIGTYQVIRDAKQGFTAPGEGPPHITLPSGECASVNNPGVPIGDQEDCVTEDEGSFVWIADVWYRIRYGMWYSEAEAVRIAGDTTGGVPFPSANRRKEAAIYGAVWRGAYTLFLDPEGQRQLDGVLEVGYSSGDENMADREFKQRALHPDFNVGLIMFEEVIRERVARTFRNFYSEANRDSARGFFSNGGVINAKYIFPRVRFRPGFAGFEIIGGVLMAWLDKYVDVNSVGSIGIFPCPASKIDGNGNCTASKYLGTEFDLAIKSRFADGHMDFSLEAGYLRMGEALRVQSLSGTELPNAPKDSFSIQARIAFIF
jgi:hypothetical protein